MFCDFSTERRSLTKPTKEICWLKFVGTIFLTNPTKETVGTAKPISLRQQIQFVAFVRKQTAKHSLPACRLNKQNERSPQICRLVLHADTGRKFDRQFVLSFGTVR